MAAPVAIKVDCPVCGGLIGWNPVIEPAEIQDDPAVYKARIRLTLDDLSARRHRHCGITPPKGAPRDLA